MTAPGIEQIQQTRRDFTQRCACRHRTALKKLRGGFVDEADGVIRIYDQNALAKMLHDELIELSKVRDIDFALANALFTFAQSASERSDAKYDDEEQCTYDPCRRKITYIAPRGQGGKNLLPED